MSGSPNEDPGNLDNGEGDFSNDGFGNSDGNTFEDEGSDVFADQGDDAGWSPDVGGDEEGGGLSSLFDLGRDFFGGDDWLRDLDTISWRLLPVCAMPRLFDWDGMLC